MHKTQRRRCPLPLACQEFKSFVFKTLPSLDGPAVQGWKFGGPNLLLATPDPPTKIYVFRNDTVANNSWHFSSCAFISMSVNLMLILYVREIEIKICSFNCYVHLRHPWYPFCPINISYYQKCSHQQTMLKWNANESLISFARVKFSRGHGRYFLKITKLKCSGMSHLPLYITLQNMTRCF